MKYRTTIIGAGGVAWSLAPAIQAAGHEIVQVFSKSENSCSALAGRLNVAYTTDKKDIRQADIYICCVNDDAIKDAVSGINFGDGIPVHTAGSVNSDILRPYAKHYGVMYPLQTFSKGKTVNVAQVPFYIEGCDGSTAGILSDFAGSFGGKVRMADSEQRRKLHIAAVFACNFTNHLYTLAYDLIEKAGLDFGELLPLIDETVAKIHALKPYDAQTGPAVRHDGKTMSLHAASLEEPERGIYEMLSKSIQQTHDEKL